jgi:hypothetical protein
MTFIQAYPHMIPFHLPGWVVLVHWPCHPVHPGRALSDFPDKRSNGGMYADHPSRLR